MEIYLGTPVNRKRCRMKNPWQVCRIFHGKDMLFGAN